MKGVRVRVSQGNGVGLGLGLVIVLPSDELLSYLNEEGPCVSF